MNNSSTAILITDLHVPYHDTRSLAAVEKYMEANRFDYYLNLGDLMDFDIISKFTKENVRAIEGRRILDDYEIANGVLDRHQSLIRANNPDAQFVLLEGNHEKRMENYLDAVPQMAGMLEVEHALHLADRKIRYVKSWSQHEILEIGEASFIHGNMHNKHHAAKMAELYGTNIFYGHTHDVMCYSKSYLGHDKTFVGQSLGCLCQYDQSYIQGKPTNWQQAVTTFHFLPNGFFTYHVSHIKNHSFVGPDGITYAG